MKRTKDKRIMIRSFLCYSLFTLSFLVMPQGARAQKVVDEMVAIVNGGAPTADLITYSDLLWQLALQPGLPLASPRIEDLNRALQLVINQRLILQEAGKLPTIEPTSKEIDAAIVNLIKDFPSSTEFYERAQSLGLSSEQLREIIRQRLSIEKYLNFRFRAFTFITDAEIEDYYKQVYVPRVRQQAPGRLVPGLNEKARGDRTVRDEISSTLTENRIESDTDAFLDSARERAQITCLDPAYQCTNQ